MSSCSSKKSISLCNLLISGLSPAPSFFWRIFNCLVFFLIAISAHPCFCPFHRLRAILQLSSFCCTRWREDPPPEQLFQALVRMSRGSSSASHLASNLTQRRTCRNFSSIVVKDSSNGLWSDVRAARIFTSTFLYN
jgi:hypothetical protein